MYDYIVCPSCGSSLGHLAPAFYAMREEAYAAAYDALDDPIDPAMLPLTELVSVPLEEVFDLLGITMMCCRKSIACNVRFNDGY